MTVAAKKHVDSDFYFISWAVEEFFGFVYELASS